MRKELFFKGQDFKDRFRRAASSCVDDFERRGPRDLETIQLAIEKQPQSKGMYEIELRVFSKDYEVISSIKTKNLFGGLKAIKHRGLRQVRTERNKLLKGRRRQLKPLSAVDNFEFEPLADQVAI